MKKKLLFLVITIFLFNCSGNYIVQKYDDSFPRWYIEDEKSSNSFFGKALGESENLEIANREAEILAVSNALFKIQQNFSGIKKQYLSKKNTTKNEKYKSSSVASDYEEKIEAAIKNYKTSSYKVIQKKIYKDKNIFKVFVKIEFNRKDLLKTLDAVN